MTTKIDIENNVREHIETFSEELKKFAVAVFNFNNEVRFTSNYNRNMFGALMSVVNENSGAFSCLLGSGNLYDIAVLNGKHKYVEAYESMSTVLEEQNVFIQSLEQKIAQLKENASLVTEFDSEERVNEIKQALSEDFEKKLAEVTETLESNLAKEKSQVESLKEKISNQENDFEAYQNDEKESKVKLDQACQALKDQIAFEQFDHKLTKETLEATKKELEILKSREQMHLHQSYAQMQEEYARRLLLQKQHVETVAAVAKTDVQEPVAAVAKTDVQEPVAADVKPYLAVCSKLQVTAEPALPSPMTVVSKKKSKSVRKQPKDYSVDELYEMDPMTIKDENTYQTEFKIKEGMEFGSVGQGEMIDPTVEIIWKNPSYFRGDDGPFLYTKSHMIPCSNGFLYKFDEETGRYYLAVYLNKFQKWDLSQIKEEEE